MTKNGGHMEEWNRRLWCSNQRAFKRFNVRAIPNLTVSTQLWPSNSELKPKHLETLSLGGCGILEIDQDASEAEVAARLELFQKDPRVVLNFDMRGVTKCPVQVSGECVEISPFESDGSQAIWYYGVEFWNNDQSFLMPIIQRLEFLDERGYLDPKNLKKFA
jgi:hypothetical protein